MIRLYDVAIGIVEDGSDIIENQPIGWGDAYRPCSKASRASMRLRIGPPKYLRSAVLR